MEGIDFLYSVAAPFFLGDMLRALQEADKLEVPHSEQEQAAELLYLKVRAFLELGHLDKLQAIMKPLLAAGQQELFDTCSQLILFLA